jgi:hypothetical protein
MDQSAPALVKVEDPHGYWRNQTLADLGCGSGGAQPSWVIGASTGETPQLAVDGVLNAFAAELEKTYTAEPADIGYVEAEMQSWVASEDGQPRLTIQVTRTASGYSAWPDALCGPNF